MSVTLSAENIHPDNLNLKEIIQRMENTYANSGTYSDSGVVKIIFSGSVNIIVEKPFTTAFIRPDRFRYAFKEKKADGRDQIFIIHLKGKEVQTYWDVQKDLKHESLDRAVASAAGVSSGTAITVPGMLLPNEITWRRAIRFNQPKRIDDEVLDNADCFRVQDIILNNLTTLWIDKKTFLLRKISREQLFDDFRAQETTTYIPNLNGEVTNDLLKFNPPKRER
ncbi:MAG: hypothetical protein V7708_01060 [Oceanicoccus sp.]